MKRFKDYASAALLVAGLLPAVAHAEPILQLYVEGSTYDYDHESWVFEPSGTDPIRLWVIGNVAGGGGKGTINDVKLSIVYNDLGAGKDAEISLNPSTTGGYGGFFDPSTPDPVGGPTMYVEDGSAPITGDGTPLPSHGAYGPGMEWQEFYLGDFALADSPIGDFIDNFPTSYKLEAGQINVYELTVFGDITDLHIDVYDHYVGVNHGKLHYVNAPFSHDAGTGVNDPYPVPEPGTLWLFFTGLLGFGLLRLRKLRSASGSWGSF